jgi:hypothetical protein
MDMPIGQGKRGVDGRVQGSANRGETPKANKQPMQHNRDLGSLPHCEEPQNKNNTSVSIMPSRRGSTPYTASRIA